MSTAIPEFKYGPRWIYFAEVNIPYYQNDTEPKLHPDAYIKMVPKEMADLVAGELYEEITGLKKCHGENVDRIFSLINSIETKRIRYEKKLHFSREVLALTLKTMVDNNLITPSVVEIQLTNYDKAIAELGGGT